MRQRLHVDALQLWGDVQLQGRASSGARNEVWYATVNREQCVVRVSRRSEEALAWELRTMGAARAHGLGVPDVVATLDGRQSVQGMVVFRRVDGHRPATESDWRELGRYLAALHEAFPAHCQRPGFLPAADLLTVDGGGDVDVTSMPDEAVERCRAAWARVASLPRSVIHGDPGEKNVFVAGDEVVLIDWDEARVDVPLFDLAALPDAVSPLSGEVRWVAQQAASAWEAAVSWRVEPEYARWRLAQVERARGQAR